MRGVWHPTRVWQTLSRLHLEKCESGRIDLTANEGTWETGSEGSNPSFSARNPSVCRFGAGTLSGHIAFVAQRIEHLTTDQKVGGSNPSERAKETPG